MNRKYLPFEIKSIDEEEGIFEGYASTFTKNPDAYGDVVDKGAFTKTIKEQAGNIKILWNHNSDEPLGIPVELREDDTGLYVKGKLTLGVQRAREILALMKDGVVNTMSIGFRIITESTVGGMNHLKEIRLFDVSPVTFAANNTAVILGVKSLEDIETELERLQALVHRSKEEEPDTSTPDTETDAGAAELEATLDGIQNEIDGFDAAEAGARLEAAIARAGG